MLTNALKKIPSKHHNNLRNALLIVTVIALFCGVLAYGTFLKESKTTTTGLLWEVEETIYYSLSDRMPYLLGAIAAALIAGFCFSAAMTIIYIVGWYKKYISIIKGNEKLSIHQISNITNINTKRVINDLQNMIDLGYLKGCYIDYQQELLINKISVPIKIVKKVVYCPQCGAVNEMIVGQSNNCTHCGSFITSEENALTF